MSKVPQISRSKLHCVEKGRKHMFDWTSGPVVAYIIGQNLISMNLDTCTLFQETSLFQPYRSPDQGDL